MRKLDLFSRFQDNLIKAWVHAGGIVAAFVALLLYFYVIESFIQSYEWYIEIPILIAFCGLVWLVLTIVWFLIGISVEDALDGIAKFVWGREPLGRLVRKLREGELNDQLERYNRLKNLAPDGNCEDCKFGVKIYEDEMFDINAAEFCMLCHRLPPSSVWPVSKSKRSKDVVLSTFGKKSLLVHGWAIVYKHDWCGEYKPKETQAQ